MYELKELLDDGNQKLHDELAKRLTIKLEQSVDSYWHVAINGSEVIIDVAETVWPAACFAHELLHVERRLQGAACPQFIDNEGGVTPQLIGYLFNVFEHVQIYSRFLELGYAAESFIGDSDVADIDVALERDLPVLEATIAQGKTPPLLNFALPYVALESPPPHPRREKYRSRLDKITPSRIAQNVPALLQKLSAYHGTDLRHVFGLFFKIANMPRIGFSDTGSQDDIIVAGNL